jgi:hypothetical protein
VSTEVHVVLVYDIPGGTVGKAVAKYFGEEPQQQLDDDLRRLKQVLETARWSGPTAARGARKPARSSRSVRRNRCRDAELAKGADACGRTPGRAATRSSSGTCRTRRS